VTPSPDVIVAGAELGLPSAHTAMSIAVYGFIAVLVARELTQPRRWIPYVGAAVLVIPIVFSRLYLGAEYLSDVLVGAGVGITCVGLFGIAFRNHPARATHWPTLVVTTAATVLVAAGWRAEYRVDPELARYAQIRVPELMPIDQWWASGWQRLPALRQDFREQRRHPLGVQYAGDLSTLRAVLVAQGWRDPIELTARTALLWLSPEPEPDRLPVLSQIHRGRHDALHLVRRSPDDGAMHIVRFWPTGWNIGNHVETPLFVGSIARLELRQQLRWFSYLGTDLADPSAPQRLRHDMETHCETAVRARPDAPGDTLLVRGCRRGSTP
jgi:hypothetical protein